MRYIALSKQTYMSIMTKSAMIRARIEPELKTQAEAILKEIGLSTSDLIAMTYRQVVMQRDLPFQARIPNTETQAAILEHEADRKAGRTRTFATVSEMFATFDSESEDNHDN